MPPFEVEDMDPFPHCGIVLFASKARGPSGDQWNFQERMKAKRLWRVPTGSLMNMLQESCEERRKQVQG